MQATTGYYSNTMDAAQIISNIFTYAALSLSLSLSSFPTCVELSTSKGESYSLEMVTLYSVLLVIEYQSLT